MAAVFCGDAAEGAGAVGADGGELGIGELIVNTIVWDQAKRLRSYELLAEVFGPGRELPDRFADVDAAERGAYPRG